jgi:hypothetical protein
MALSRPRLVVSPKPYRFTPALLALCAVGIADPAEAQTPRWDVDVNASRIEYDSVAPLNAPSIVALAEWQRPSFFGRLSGSVTGFESSGWSGQARGDVAGWLAPFGLLSPVRIEVAATAGGLRHSSGFDSFIGRGDARIHLRSRQLGAWVGASAASARNSFDTASVTGVVPGGGVWAQTRAVRATLSVVGTRVSGETYPEANLALSLTRGSLDLTVYGGYRQTPGSLAGSDEDWAGATASLWVHPRAAVVVSGGQYASDVLQGLPGGQFVSVGFRFTRRRARPIPITARAPIVYTPEAVRTGAIGFMVEGAAQVQIAGDWTGWRLVPLEQDAAGRWLVPASLAPGVYRFNLRVDGERWFVPEGVAEIDDGYGGRVGLLIISN